MGIIRDNTIGDLIVDEDTELHDHLHGSVTVKRQKALQLFASVSGDLGLEPESAVFVFGKVGGDIINGRTALQLGVGHHR